MVIGSFLGGSGNAFTVTFNANATSAAVEALIENLTFANTSDTPVLTRVLTLDVTDADGAHLTHPLAREVRITPENDAPTITFDNVSFTDSGASDAITNNNAPAITVAPFDASVRNRSAFETKLPIAFHTDWRLIRPECSCAFWTQPDKRR